MTSDRKKPTAGFWITVALVMVLVGYPLSYGPWCWWGPGPGAIPPWAERMFSCLYSPIIWLAKNGPEPIRALLWWWIEVGR